MLPVGSATEKKSEGAIGIGRQAIFGHGTLDEAHQEQMDGLYNLDPVLAFRIKQLTHLLGIIFSFERERQVF